MIKEYNSNMDGVDLADMLVALYRTQLCGHRWYLPLFSQILDICVNNAWLLYRRGAEDKSKIMASKEFRYEIYQSLISFERSISTNKHNKNVQIIKKPVAERPIDAVGYDQVGNLPTFTSKGRCKYCTKGQTKFYCQKCKGRLCLVEDHNCYYEYHTK